MVYNFLTSRSKKGFTLLELLIVIAIIGILISLGVVSYSSAQMKARDSKRKSDLKAMQSAWEQYYSNSTDASYPANCSVDMSTFMPSGLPKDPKTGSSYVIDSNCDLTGYCFCATLESGTGNAAAVSNNSTCTYGSGSVYCVSSLQN